MPKFNVEGTVYAAISLVDEEFETKEEAERDAKDYIEELLGFEFDMVNIDVQVTEVTDATPDSGI